MTGYLEELRINASKYGMDDVAERLDSIAEAVIYGSALAAYAKEEIDIIWLEVEAAKELFMEPPTEEELKLHHPSFDV